MDHTPPQKDPVDTQQKANVQQLFKMYLKYLALTNDMDWEGTIQDACVYADARCAIDDTQKNSPDCTASGEKEGNCCYQKRNPDIHIGRNAHQATNWLSITRHM